MSVERSSVLSQGVQIIKKMILAGSWVDSLPSERKISETLGLSRTTVRKALNQLTSEGILSPSTPRQTRKIIMMPTAAASSSLNRVHHSRDATKQVIWLTSRVDAKLPGVNYNLFTSLRELLAKHDISLKIKMIPSNCLTEPEVYLSDWISKEPAHVYLLHGASEKMRLWFAANQLKAIIIGGSCRARIIQQSPWILWPQDKMLFRDCILRGT